MRPAADKQLQYDFVYWRTGSAQLSIIDFHIIDNFIVSVLYIWLVIVGAQELCIEK